MLIVRTDYLLLWLVIGFGDISAYYVAGGDLAAEDVVDFKTIFRATFKVPTQIEIDRSYLRFERPLF